MIFFLGVKTIQLQDDPTIIEGKLQQLDDPYVGALSNSGKENLWQNQGQGGEPRSAGSEGRTTGIQKKKKNTKKTKQTQKTTV